MDKTIASFDYFAFLDVIFKKVTKDIKICPRCGEKFNYIKDRIQITGYKCAHCKHRIFPMAKIESLTLLKKASLIKWGNFLNWAKDLDKAEIITTSINIELKNTLKQAKRFAEVYNNMDESEIKYFLDLFAECSTFKLSESCILNKVFNTLFLFNKENIEARKYLKALKLSHKE